MLTDYLKVQMSDKMSRLLSKHKHKLNNHIQGVFKLLSNNSTLSPLLLYIFIAFLLMLISLYAMNYVLILRFHKSKNILFIILCFFSKSTVHWFIFVSKIRHI